MESLITDRSISISSLFDNFFEVAEFQREYVWTTDDVSELLNDIWISFKIDPNPKQYFIGAVVLSQITGNSFYIVDGQQRISTLFLILCGIKKTFSGLDPSKVDEINLINGKLCALFLDTKGARPKYRLIGTDNGQEILEAAFNNNVNFIDSKDDSSNCLKEAYLTCVSFLENKIADLAIGISFLNYVLNQVCVLPYVARDLNHALTVFETLNSTGVGLTPIDLVKNLLFKYTDRNSWEALQDKWKDFLFLLEQTNEKPQRFLKYFLLVEYGEKSSDSKVYDWIRDNNHITKIQTDAFTFLETLTSFAESYQHIILGRAPDGSSNYNISNVRKLAGRARQHFPFLISIKGFPKDRLDNCILATESLFMAYGVQQMYTGDIEQTFSEWTINARECQSTDKIDIFYNTIILPELKKIGKLALTKLSTISESSIPKQKLTYLLCRLDSYLQILVESGSPFRDISYGYKGFDNEHILSKSSSNWKERGYSSEEEFILYKSKLGNITILEKALNRAIKDKNFDAKKLDGYEFSNYLLTRGIAGKPPGNGKIAIALGYINSYKTWNKEDIDDRQNNLATIASKAFKWN